MIAQLTKLKMNGVVLAPWKFDYPIQHLIYSVHTILFSFEFI